MHYYWIQDQIYQGHFTVEWKKGIFQLIFSQNITQHGTTPQSAQLTSITQKIVCAIILNSFKKLIRGKHSDQHSRYNNFDFVFRFFRCCDSGKGVLFLLEPGDKVTEFFQGNPERAGFLRVVKESSELGFGGRGDHFFQDMVGHMDGAIQDGVRAG
jgi:hypothetical protein